MKNHRAMNDKAVLVIDTVHPLLHQILLENNFIITEAYDWDKAKIIDQLPSYNGIVIRSRIKIDKEMIDAGKALKFIARFGAGMENIDVAYAKQKNIKCLHAAAGNKDAVAEHAIGMLLALFNHLNRADKQVRQYQWLREANRGEELAGKTVAVIGYGNMGSAFVQRLQGFNVRVLVYDKYKQNFLSNHSWAEESSLQRIQQEADVVSLHIPLTPETNGMINGEWLGAFKKPFYLINTARGKILRTADALELLNQNKILGMCLDVLEYEDTSFEHLNEQHQNETIKALFNSDKVILTPHIAGWSHQSNVKLAQALFEAIDTCYQSSSL
ncbi:MAG: NAD(P)-dependent oxidoreductase [Bacteroidota bacterium]|jgi:D-3-phosphoglycerate dehydrogenase